MKPTLWQVLVVVLLAFDALASSLGEHRYPGTSWERWHAPEQLGWSREKLAAAREYATTIHTAAVMVIVDGQVLDEWGETATRFNVHSIRKSFLSALYGIHVSAGRINLSATLEELGIDDNEPSLTFEEQQATVGDLLKARSGVYHAALYETVVARARRPPRGSHAPGTFWYYNNWDFNVLGTIFERQTKTNLFAEFKARIAEPLGMEDFRLEDCTYVTGAASVYPAYPFRMTARDMARFGLLFLRAGVWQGQQLIPRDWVQESLTAYSEAGAAGGYGYLWWVATNGQHLPDVTLPAGSYSAQGHKGHFILVIPQLAMVIVHRVNTDMPTREVTDAQFGELVRLILEARPPETTGGP
jgi:CubicO group peptidase (beta-lactamase class C family)